MLLDIPFEFLDFVTYGTYEKDGKIISENGAHVTADATPEAIAFFRDINENRIRNSKKPIYTFH